MLSFSSLGFFVVISFPILFPGSFKAGKRHGFGVYTYGNGAKYEGEWVAGLFQGQGNYRFPNGDRYIGEVSDLLLFITLVGCPGFFPLSLSFSPLSAL